MVMISMENLENQTFTSKKLRLRMRYECQTYTIINYSGCKNVRSAFLVAFVRFQVGDR